MPKTIRRINSTTDSQHRDINRRSSGRNSPLGTLLKWESELSYEYGETDHSASDFLFNDKSSLQIEAPSPPPLSNPALSSSGWVDQRITTGGRAKPETKKKKKGKLADVVLLRDLAPDKPDIASRIGGSSPLLTPDSPT